eukprot:TRINITY_DN6309_c0_g1_i1.p1 TRINITY_DN6309_c0_g1~~TRINITY_DN6309_c0_g1_i1.p1  ORF type:complete len:231 (+),score=32.79 TRINITY_DN6309_c0_g1_i1:32-694(+)
MKLRDFCNRICWAFFLSALLVVLLIVSVASPWYTIIFDAQSWGDGTIVFYWKGVHSSGKLLYLQEEGWQDWDILHSDKPKDFYDAAGALEILALIGAFVLAVLVLFGLWLPATAPTVQHTLRGTTKWMALALAIEVLVLGIIGWALFIGFPSALSDSSICAATIHDYWCEDFIGSADNSILTVTWGPTIGWAFAVMASAVAIANVIVVALIPSAHGYNRV